MKDPTPDQELVYVFDTLCGWCWGFSPVIRKIHQAYEHRLPLTVLSGGMVTGDRVGTLGPMAGHILAALDRVEHLTGQVFSPEYRHVLERDVRVHDSFPPAVSLSLARDLDPDRTLDFAHIQQEAIFVKGLDPSAASTQEYLAHQMGFDVKDFVKGLADPIRRKTVNDEFHFVKNLGINGYPSLLLRQGNTWTMLAHGFTAYGEIETRLERALA